MSKEEQEKADTTLARAMFVSGIPLSITENKYWVEHYKHILPSWKITPPYCLSHSLLDKEHDRCKKWWFKKLLNRNH